MASFRDRRIKGVSQTINMREEISVQKGFHVPPLTMKDSKKKRKEKKKARNGTNQSKNSKKLQTEQWTNAEMSDNQSNSRVKAKEQKNSKSKNLKEEGSAPAEEERSDLSPPEQDSLRWDGALDDPVAEAQRLELYRANRRKRYMASREAFLQNVQSSLCLDSNSSKLKSRNKPAVLV